MVGSGPLFARPWSLALAPDGSVIVTDSGGGAVFLVDPATGDRTRVFPAAGAEALGTAGPEGALVEADGSLLVTDSAGARLLRVPGRRARRREVEVLSQAGVRGQGPALQVPVRLQRLPDGTLLVLDQGLRAVVEIDRRSGDRKVLGGEGPPLDEPDDLVVLPEGRIFVSDNFTGRITEVDRATGNRRLLADVRVPPGPTITRPFGLGPGADGELLAADPIIGTVLAFRVDTGERRLVTSPRTGTGVSCPQVFDAVALPDGSIVCSNPRGACLVRVTPDGRRTTLSGRPQTETLMAAVDNCVARDDHRTVVMDAMGGRLLEVDPSTGAFRELSGPAVGGGPEMRCPNEVALDGPSRAWVVDWKAGLLEVDLTTGDRRSVIPGDHPEVRQLFDVAVLDGRVYLLDTRVPALFRLDGTSLDRLGRPGLLYPGRLVASRNRLLVTDMEARLVLAVDPESGERTVVSRGPFDMPEALVEVGDQILVSDVDRGQILAVEPLRLISGPERGSGPPLDAPEDMAAAPNGQVLVSDPGYGGLIELDPATGDRRLIRLRGAP